MPFEADGLSEMQPDHCVISHVRCMLTLAAFESADAASLVAKVVQPNIASGVLLSGITAACGQARLAELPQRSQLAWSVYELANAKRLTLSKEAQVALWDTQAGELGLVVQLPNCTHAFKCICTSNPAVCIGTPGAHFTDASNASAMLPANVFSLARKLDVAATT